MGVSIWEGSKAQDLIDAIRNIQKVDKQQGTANSGKALVVGPDGLVVPDSVITTRMIMAFSEIFRHVVYTDGDSKKYYDELMAALMSSGVKTIISVSATYDSSGHTVYQYTKLNALKEYITVTVRYSDGSTQTVSDYILSGTLDNATSIITVSYMTFTTTISVPVEVDNSLIYHTNDDIILDGNTNVNTGILLSDTNKAFTVVGDFTDASPSTDQRHIVNSKMTVNGTPTGIVAMVSGNNGLKKYQSNAYGSLSAKSNDFDLGMHRIKFAISHPANSRMFYHTIYVDGQMQLENVGIEGLEFVSSSQPMIIGSSQNNNGYWMGTAHLCNVYNRQLSVSEIKTVLGVI